MLLLASHVTWVQHAQLLSCQEAPGAGACAAQRRCCRRHGNPGGARGMAGARSQVYRLDHLLPLRQQGSCKALTIDHGK